MESRTMSRAAERAEKFAAACEKSGQRTFHLQQSKSTPDQPLRFITFGCQGSGKKEQRDVALQLNTLCSNPATRPDFILVLGDNIYPWGASSADDPGFKQYFDQMYLNLPYLKNMPFFLIPGNHDENLGNAVMTAIGVVTDEAYESGIPRIMHQVAHTFMPEYQFSAEKKEEIYTQPSLNINELPEWNMPRRYYTLIHQDVQIFCVDSNTYVNEFLALEAKRMTLTPKTDMADWLKQKAAVNQAAWLQLEHAEARLAGRKIILAEHHPLYTAGKRAYERDFHNDLGRYLDQREIYAVAKLLGVRNASSETPFSFCLRECYRLQNLVFDLTLTAHDHDIYNYNNKHNDADPYKICQLVVGSGGGDLQDRNKFDEQKFMGCFLKQTGVAIVTHTPGDEHFNYSIHTSDRKNHLVFNTHQPGAIIAWDEQNHEHDELQDLFAVVETAINQYLNFIATRQTANQGGFFSKTVNLSHGNKGAERAHQLWAYLKQYHPQPITTAVDIIHTMTRRGTFELSGSDNSLITYLDKAMKGKYRMNMEQFAAMISKRPIKGLKIQ